MGTSSKEAALFMNVSPSFKQNNTGVLFKIKQKLLFRALNYINRNLKSII